MKNLFIVGAQRSGSTYLYRLLNEHPQVMMAQPVKPEPKFFLDEQLSGKGREFYEATYFSDCPPGTLYCGEKSSSYIESPSAAERIRGLYPDARILMILRNPVERAWSNYRFSVFHGLESMSFESALAAEQRRLSHATFSTSVNPYAYRLRGQYMDYINGYLTLFDSAQLDILIFEEIVGNLANAQKLYRWLGINDDVTPSSLNEVVNPGNKNVAAPPAALKDLAQSYLHSMEQLENYLGRPIDAWRKYGESL